MNSGTVCRLQHFTVRTFYTVNKDLCAATVTFGKAWKPSAGSLCAFPGCEESEPRLLQREVKLPHKPKLLFLSQMWFSLTRNWDERQIFGLAVLSRSVDRPQTDPPVRGPIDCFSSKCVQDVCNLISPPDLLPSVHLHLVNVQHRAPADVSEQELTLKHLLMEEEQVHSNVNCLHSKSVLRYSY